MHHEIKAQLAGNVAIKSVASFVFVLSTRRHYVAEDKYEAAQLKVYRKKETSIKTSKNLN